MPDIFLAKTNNQVSTKEAPEAYAQTPPKPTENKRINEESNSGSVHLFTSYCENPDDITFENQEEDEKVLLFIRKDVITNFSWMFIGIILIILPLIIVPILIYFHLPTNILPYNYQFILSASYYLLVTTFLFIKFITWYFNIDIVTQKRVVDIDFEGIVYKNVAATKLTLVQDVSYSQVGVIRTVFDYGDVLVQTAGTIDNFTFEAVPRPEDAVHVIENLIGKRNEQL